MLRRAAAVWLILFAVYAATIGLDAFEDSNYAGDEPHYLLAAQSLIHDGDIDVLDDYQQRSYAGFYPDVLQAQGQLTKRRLNEPHGGGFALFIAPAYAVGDVIEGGGRGGANTVEIFLAALAALAFAFAYLLALRVEPDPWAFWGTLAVGLSAPALAYGSAVYPELAAGCALAGAALLALGLYERVSRRAAFGCFALLGLTPWLGVKFVPAAIVIGAFAVRGMLREGRRTLAIGSAELATFSLALFVGLSEGFFGGPTPYAARAAGASATGADGIGDYLERSYRLVTLLGDPEYGLLIWAPVILLALFGIYLVWRSREDGLRRTLLEQVGVERTGWLCAIVFGVHVAGRGVRGAGCDRLLVPGAPAGRRAAADGAAGRLGAAACATRGDRARAARGGAVGVGLRRRSLQRRRARASADALVAAATPLAPERQRPEA